MTDEEFENRIITIMHETLPSVGIAALTVTVSGIQRTPTSTLNFARAIAALHPSADEIEKLRKAMKGATIIANTSGLLLEANEVEIKRLREQLDSVKEALAPFAAFAAWISLAHPGWDHDDFYFTQVPKEMPRFIAWRKARAVLKDLTDEIV